PRNLQSRAALVATDGVAFVDVFFVHINLAFAHGTFNHDDSSKILLLYDSLTRLQAQFEMPTLTTLYPGKRTRERAFAGRLSRSFRTLIIEVSMHQKLNERVVDLDPLETAEWVEALDQ